MIEFIYMLKDYNQKTVGYGVIINGTPKEITKAEALKLVAQQPSNALIPRHTTTIRLKTGQLRAKTANPVLPKIERIGDQMVQKKGPLMSRKSILSLCTEATSKGIQEKYYDGDHWIKLDTLGYEGLAEELTSRLLNCSRDVRFVHYNTVQVITHSGAIRKGCISKSFVPDGCIDKPMRSLLEHYMLDFSRETKRLAAKEKILWLIDAFQTYYKIDITKFLMRVVTLDAITLNGDRHLNNIAILIVKDKCFPAPIFDNGLGLLADVDKFGRFNPSQGRLRAKCLPFAKSFKKQLKAMTEITDYRLILNRKEVETLLDTYTNPHYPDVLVDRALTVLRQGLREMEDFIKWV